MVRRGCPGCPGCRWKGRGPPLDHAQPSQPPPHPTTPHPTAAATRHPQGDATYLIVKEDKTIETYGLNAVCTHLGCVVPWNRAANKYMCPCHGSQYDPTGKVIRGPAPLSLALAHMNEVEGNAVLSPWTET